MYSPPIVIAPYDFFCFSKLYAVLSVASISTFNNSEMRAYFKHQKLTLEELFIAGHWDKVSELEQNAELNKQLKKCPACFKTLSLDDINVAFKHLQKTFNENKAISSTQKPIMEQMLREAESQLKYFFINWRRELFSDTAMVLEAEAVVAMPETGAAKAGRRIRDEYLSPPATPESSAYSFMTMASACCTWLGQCLKARPPAEDTPLIR